MAIIKHKDIKRVKNCRKCGKKLPQYSHHHSLCHECWTEIQLKKGNFAHNIVAKR